MITAEHGIFVISVPVLGVLDYFMPRKPMTAEEVRRYLIDECGWRETIRVQRQEGS